MVAIPVFIVIGVSIYFIAARNITWFSCPIDPFKGIEEQTYVEINGQKQFVSIRGKDRTNPVILFLHGGPMAPDSYVTYTYSNELIDDYTFVCWEQRGCGRTYFANPKDKNETVTFDQALEDVNAMADYLCDRFGCEKIIVMNADTSAGEADFVGRTIKMMVDKGKFKFSDCAVLYRMNALSRNIETTLHNLGIPFRVYGGMRFYDRKEIKDVLAYLRLINDPRDNIAFERIINVPKRGIGDATIEKIRQYALSDNISMFEVAEHSVDYPELVRSANRICAFTDLINEMKEKLREDEMDFAHFVDYVENESGIIEEITEQREKKGEIIDRVENLKELLSEAAEYDKAHRAEPVDMDTLEIDEGDGLPVEVDEDFFFDTATADTTEGILGLYLENASLFTEGDEFNDTDDFVKLMSIHSAKGLEFGAVFIIGLEEGVFPSYRSIQSMEDTEEERRLMYVAITRAKKNLFIVLARQRMLFGQTNCNQPSRFIKEINPEHLYLMGSKRETPKDVPQGETQREKSKKSIASAIKSQFTVDKKKQNTMREGQLGPNDLFEGMKVVHPRFGEGVILKVEPVGGDALVTVDFDGMRKNMLANAAGLSKA